MAELALIAPLGAIEVGAGAAAAATGIGAAGLSTIGAGAFAAVAGGFSLSTLFTGASLAWSIGSSLFASGQSLSGPRIKDLHVQSAAFGAPMKRTWGIDRNAGELIWVGSNGKGGRGIREKKHTEGGKGGLFGGPEVTTYTYQVDCAVSIVCASNVIGVRRIWADTKLIYDASKEATLQTHVGTAIKLKGKRGKVTFYDGNETQQPPALIEELAGVGQTSAYRNQFLAVFQNFQLADFANRIPHFSFETFTAGSEAWSEVGFYAVNTSHPAAGNNTLYSYIDANGEIYVMIAGTPAFYQQTFEGGPYDGEFRWLAYQLASNGDIIPAERVASDTTEPLAGGNAILGHADEPGFMSGSGSGYAFWFSVETNSIVGFSRPAAEIFPDPIALYFQPDRYAKKDDVIYFVDSLDLFRYHLPDGSFLNGSKSLLSFGATYPDWVDIQRGDDYLWVFHYDVSATTYYLHKLDPDSMEILDTITLGSSSTLHLSAFFVESDDVIDFFGGTTPPNTVYFYRYEDGALTLLASPLTTTGGTMTDHLIVRNGLWYTKNTATGDIDVWGPSVDLGDGCVPLWQIVRDICIADGLEESEIDVTELTDCVRGYTIDQSMSGRDAILPLQRYGFFDGRERDLKIHFKKRGAEPEATIPEADMAARPGIDAPLPDLIAITRAQETELPIRVHLKFKDQDASYQTGLQHSSRLTSESSHTITVEVPVVMDATKARQIVDVLMANYWQERAPKEILVSRKYMLLDAADPITLEVAA